MTIYTLVLALAIAAVIVLGAGRVRRYFDPTK
jgi:hypothetical protein